MATETTLLHMEDFKIPEHLARFAVKAGMWGFVRKMSPYMKEFVQQRRNRGVDPKDTDPEAFGAPAPEGAVAANHTVITRGGKKRGFGRVVVTVAAAAVLFVVVKGRDGKRVEGSKKRKDKTKGR